MGLIGFATVITDRQWAGLVMVAIFVSFGGVLWRMATARLTLRGDVLVARNFFDTQRMHLRDIERFDKGMNAWGIELLLLHTDRKITVNAIQKSNWAVWRGTRTKADELVDQLNALVLAARE
jgi:hypothetical protein